MRYRCENPVKHNYKYYGGRGIRVCERWQDFASFLADMGERPDGATLDRINLNGNYEPSNCRWATKQAQMNNMSTNRVLIIDAQEKTMTEWSRIYGVPVGTIWMRLRKGWSPADAVQKPVRAHMPYDRNQRANI
jgi:hypothetical protein